LEERVVNGGKEYGFGVIGTGLIARFHAQAITEARGARLAGVLSRSPERAREFADQFHCRGHSSLEEMLAEPGLDVVSICTPSGAHLEPALQAVAAGKHLLVEKPLEITLRRCDAIIEAARQKGVRVGGIFQSRFYEGAQLLKKAVETGRFGRLVLGDAYVKWYRSQEYYDKGGWKGTRRLDGGGALMNQSIHAIDLLQWFMGPVATVQACKGVRGHERIEVEDTAVAALEFVNGAYGVIEGSTAAFPGFLKRLEISGTEGSAILEEEDLKLWKFEPGQREDEDIRRRYASRTKTGGGAADPGAISVEGHRRQYEEFVSALAEGRQPAVDAVEARRAVAIVLAIYRSAETGKKVRLQSR
jgi:UDP-N-acetyl-2-amino-2-deoxyglucuronate dehydrogenase